MSKSILCIFTIIVFCFCEGKCNDSTRVDFNKNILFVEVAGNRPYYSLNYERILYQGNNLSYGFRVGFSILTNDVSTPVALNVFTSPGNHHLEMGVGLTPYIHKYRTFLSEKDFSDKYLYIIPSVGYRYQKHTGKLFFRTGLCPLIFLDPPSYNMFDVQPKIIPSAYIALGFTF